VIDLISETNKIKGKETLIKHVSLFSHVDKSPYWLAFFIAFFDLR